MPKICEKIEIVKRKAKIHVINNSECKNNKSIVN